MKTRLLCGLLLLAAMATPLAMANEAPGRVGAARATELRADKLASAPVVGYLKANTRLRIISLEGGWALVEGLEAGIGGDQAAQGWIRASALDLNTEVSAASALEGGRSASGRSALTLGIRALPPRNNRHALIIGIGRYADPAIPPLPGVKFDRESATQMAQSMQVPPENITYLQDAQASGEGIRGAIKALSDRVQEGDRVFVHFSGHGTRYLQPDTNTCTEALFAYDGGQRGMISNLEMAELLKGITAKTDKLFVMYDACHSGGIVKTAALLRTRGIKLPTDEGTLRGKFAPTSEECSRPVNVKTRNLVIEAVEKGSLPQDIIHMSASRDNEISFDDEAKGGLATQYVRDCMLRDAVDLDKSGSISMDEIRACAQAKIDKRMTGNVDFKPHNLTLNGNVDFVPAWFSQVALAPIKIETPPPPPPPPLAIAPLPAPAVPSAPPRPPAAAPAPPPVAVAPPPPPPEPPALTGQQALKQMHDQRNGKWKVQATSSRAKLQIGKDAVDFSIQSDRAGYVYVALAGSDNKSVYLLFPNDLDRNNRIEAGQKLQLPRPEWRVKAGGPAGLDHLLVVVADAPRDLSAFKAAKAGPFVVSLNDVGGRAQLGALMTTGQSATSAACASRAARLSNPACSDAYGAALFSVEETP